MWYLHCFCTEKGTGTCAESEVVRISSAIRVFHQLELTQGRVKEVYGELYSLVCSLTAERYYRCLAKGSAAFQDFRKDGR
jgi:hypothetical protein